jgi:multiple sugar transport system ATP-binding protein
MQTDGGVAVTLEGISKIYPNGFQALRDINLGVDAGEWMVLVGSSGCGKTTTLRIVAGLEEPSGGTVQIAGKTVNRIAPWKRDVAMVFQRPALAPTHTVRQNLAFGALETNQAEIDDIAAILDLTAEMGRFPHQLSGGQQQRVALGRSLVRHTPLCLLDEPLGHLDAPLRDELRKELKLWHQQRKPTVFSVTHDPREAWALGQRVAVMDRGVVLQTGTPEEVYRNPCNRFVASFFAQSAMNFFEAQLRNNQNPVQWIVSDWPDPIACERAEFAQNEAVLGLRAEDVRIGACGESMAITLVERTPRGCWVTGDVHGRQVTGWAEQNVNVGEKVNVMLNWTRVFVFDRVTGKTLRAAKG